MIGDGRDTLVAPRKKKEDATPMANETGSLSSLLWLWGLDGEDPMV